MIDQEPTNPALPSISQRGPPRATPTTITAPSFRAGTTTLCTWPETSEEQAYHEDDQDVELRRTPSPLTMSLNLEMSEMATTEPHSASTTNGIAHDYKREATSSPSRRPSMDVDLEINSKTVEESKKLAYDAFIKKAVVNGTLIALW